MGLWEEDFNLRHLGRLRAGHGERGSGVSGETEALHQHQGCVFSIVVGKSWQTLILTLTLVGRKWDMNNSGKTCAESGNITKTLLM